jgi:hypothetical protein
MVDAMESRSSSGRAGGPEFVSGIDVGGRFSALDSVDLEK